jgi:hypothetical protein
MYGTIVWALLTGLVTGSVWTGIVLIGRQRRIDRLQPRLFDELQSRLEQLDDIERRLAETEGRLEFAERLLAEQQPPRKIAPPG